MTEQKQPTPTPAKLTTEQLQQRRELILGMPESRFARYGKPLLDHIDALAAENARLKAELADVKAKLAALTAPVTEQLDAVVQSSHLSFKNSIGRPTAEWDACTASFRQAFTAAVEHAYAAGRASLATDLATKDAEALAEIVHKVILSEGISINIEWDKLTSLQKDRRVMVAQAVAAHVRAESAQQIAELTAKLEAAERQRDENGAGWNRMSLEQSQACHARSVAEADRDRLAAELKTSRAAATEEAARGDRLAAELVGLRGALTDLAERAERARGILQSSKSNPGNWGMLDTAGARAVLSPAPVADHSGDAAEKVEANKFYLHWTNNSGTRLRQGPFATEAEAHKCGERFDTSVSWSVVEEKQSHPERPAFVCSACGGSHYGETTAEIFCECRGCNWRGTWRDVADARGQAEKPSATVGKVWYVYFFKTIHGAKPAHVYSDKEPLPDYDHQNEVVIPVVHKSALDAERQRADDLQRRLQEAEAEWSAKVLELERRCNNEHFKAEAHGAAVQECLSNAVLLYTNYGLVAGKPVGNLSPESLLPCRATSAATATFPKRFSTQFLNTNLRRRWLAESPSRTCQSNWFAFFVAIAGTRRCWNMLRRKSTRQRKGWSEHERNKWIFGFQETHVA